MTAAILKAVPLTPQRFATYGDVLFDNSDKESAMNDQHFQRFNDLARFDIDTAAAGRPCVSIARCRGATSLPYRIRVLERHPKGNQIFMPLTPFSFLVVVAPPGETVDTGQLRAFVTNGRQGINYHRGVWHMPMIGLEPGQEFLVIDRLGEDANCDELRLGAAVTLDR